MLSEAEIDSLIGGNFIALNDPLPKPIAKKREASIEHASRFISGPTSQFIVESGIGEATAEAYAIHIAAEQGRKFKQQAQMLTLNITPVEKRRFLSSLDKKVRDLRNFIVTDVSVFELALSTAVEEARDALEQITGSKVESLNMKRVLKAADLLVDMYTVNKLSRVLGVPADIRKAVMEQIGIPDGNRKQENLSKLSELLGLQQTGKGPNPQMRGVDSPRTPQSFPRRASGTGTVRNRA